MHRIKWKYKHDNPNVWDSVKAVLREWFIGIQAYLKKQERKKKKKHNFTSMSTTKKDMKNPKVSRRKDIMKIRVK